MASETKTGHAQPKAFVPPPGTLLVLGTLMLVSFRQERPPNRVDASGFKRDGYAFSNELHPVKNQIQLGLPISSQILQEELPDGFEIHDDGQRYFEFDDTGFSLWVFALGWAGSVSAGVVTKFICDAIEKRSSKPAKRIIVNETHIEFDREKITQLIQRSIEIEEDNADSE